MLRIISHRGNTNGIDKKGENSPMLVKHVIYDLFFDCEVDLWAVDGKLYLGHDEPLYPIDIDFLRVPGLWVHAKNIEALNFLTRYSTKMLVNYFWHENDKYTLTSWGFIWAYPGMSVVDEYKTIAVLPEISSTLNYQAFSGICTDYPIQYRDMLNVQSNSV